MIEMDMSLETELGVDSIKRVEILSDVQKQLNVEAQNVAALSRTQTVGEVVDAMIAELKTGYEPEMIEMDMSLETELGVDSIKRVEILSDVQKQLNVEAQNVAALSRTQTVGE